VQSASDPTAHLAYRSRYKNSEEKTSEEEQLAPVHGDKSKIANYRTTNLNPRSAVIAGLEPRAIVRSLPDADARESTAAPGLIPHDLPLPRRTWILPSRP